MTAARRGLNTLCWFAPLPLIVLALVVTFAASCGAAQHPGAAVADELEGEVLRASRAVAAAETTCTDVTVAMVATAKASLQGDALIARLELAKQLQHECNVTAGSALEDLEVTEASIEAVASADLTNLRCSLSKAAIAMRKIQGLLAPLGRPMPAIVDRALAGAEREGASCAPAADAASTDGGAS